MVIIASAYAYFDRSAHDMLLEAIGATYGSGGPMSPVLNAYLGKDILLAIGMTFGINLVVGSFVSVTLPSMIVPFLGLAVAIYRAVMWGLIFSPDPGVALTGENIGFGLFAVGLLLLEGQGYVLVMLAAVLQGNALLSPKTVGEEKRWRGYVAGLKLTGKLYILIAVVLFVAAIYEVLSVVFLPQ